jgi:hypothetical protein
MNKLSRPSRRLAGAVGFGKPALFSWQDFNLDVTPRRSLKEPCRFVRDGVCGS